MTTSSVGPRVAPVIVFALCVLIAGQSSAGDSPWFVTARIAEASVEALLGDRHPKRIDDDAGATAIDVGYQINRHLAVEFGYQDLGDHGGFGSPCRQIDDACIERLASIGLCAEGTECTEILTTLSASVDGFSLALVPVWPFAERWALRGKAGIVAWDADVTIERGFFLAGASRTTFGGELFSSRDLLTGIGLHYSLPSGLGFLAQWETFDLDAEVASIGVSWRF